MSSLSLPDRVRRPHRTSSFRLKLFGVLLAVIAVGVGVVFVLADRAVDRNFRTLSLELGTAHARDVQGVFEDYYAKRGSWAGVQTLLGDPANTMGGLHELVIADSERRVIATSVPSLRGTRIATDELRAGIELRTGSRIVAFLVPVEALDVLSGPERSFRSAVRRAILTAGMIAALVAMALAVLLVRQLTRPLGRLAAAAEHMAEGDLRQEVTVESRDEIGRLADSFNAMSRGLDRSEQLRRRLIADIAHELRNPLAVLKADLQALLDGVYPLTKAQIASLQDETLLLEHLVDDLRTLSLADAGELVLRREPTDLVATLRRFTASRHTIAQAKGVELDLDTPLTPVIVSIDADRIRQVLTNLFTNAVRHTPQGGRITITAQEAGTEVRVAVADTGPGIAAAKLGDVFERFWRADQSRARETGGSGLGLAIAKQLIDAHGGRIHAENQPEGGARFVFTLPRADEASTAIAGSAAS